MKFSGFSNTEKVGIGTTSAPEFLLDAQSTGTPTLCVRNTTSSQNAKVHIGEPNTTAYGLELRWEGNLGNVFFDNRYNHSTRPHMYFRMRVAGTPITAMTIDPAGNIGIGTNAPDAKLRVYGGDVTLSYSAGSNPFTLRAINDAFWMIGDNAATQEWVMSKTYAHDYAFHFKYTPGTAGAGAGIMKMGQQSKNHANYTHGITAFYTNGLERMRIAANGAIQFNSYGSGTHTGTSAYKLSVDSSGNIIETSIGSGAVDGAGTANYISKWTDGDTIGNSNITDDGTSIRFTTHTDGTYIPVAVPNTINTGWNNSGDSHALWINYYGYLGSTTKFRDLKIGNGKSSAIATFDGSSGFVGIGTTAPANNLHIKSSVSNGSTSLFIERNASTYGLLLTADNNGNSRLSAQGAVANLVFEIGGSEKLRISNNGKVGIGTTAPADDLHVYGAGNVALLESSSQNVWLQMKGSTTYSWQIGSTDKGLQFYNDETSAYRVVFKKDGNVGIGTLTPAYELDVPSGTVRGQQVFAKYGSNKLIQLTWGGTTSEGRLWIGNNDSATVLINGNSTSYINNGANFGIGTTAPATKLHAILDSSATNTPTDVLRLGHTSSGSTAVGFGALIRFDAERTGTTTDGMGRLGFVADTMTSSRVDGAFIVQTGLDGSYSERFRIKSDGKVGIGTTNPSKLLHVHGSGPQVLVKSSDSTDATVNIDSGASQDSYLVFSQGGTAKWAIIHDYPATGKLVIHNYTNNANRVTFLPDGKVGINNDSPSYKLDVNGNFRAAGAAYFNGAAYTTGQAYLNGGLRVGGANANYAGERLFTIPAFPNGVANQKVDLYWTAAFWGYMEIEITGSYTNQNMAGVLTKSFALGLNTSNNIHTNESWYSNLGGLTANNFAISDVTWDSTNSRYRIQIVHRVSTANTVRLKLRCLGDSAAITDTFMSGTSVSAIYTTDTTAFDMPVKQLAAPNDNAWVDGYLGIGTTSPTTNLHIKPASGNARLKLESDLNTADVEMMLDSAGTTRNAHITFYTNGTQRGGVGYVASDTIMKMWGDNNPADDHLCINSAGNVGIGTASPGKKLHVYSGASGIGASSDVNMILEGASNVGLAMLAPNNQGSRIEFGSVADNNEGIIYYNNTGSYFSIYTNGTRQVDITSAGKVGIGQTAPQNPLEVDLNQSNGTLTGDSAVHFGGPHHTTGQIMGITLGYRESNASYRKIGIVAAGLSDSEANQDFHILVNTANSAASCSIADKKLSIYGTTGIIRVHNKFGIGGDPGTHHLYAAGTASILGSVGIGSQSPDTSLFVRGAFDAGSGYGGTNCNKGITLCSIGNGANYGDGYQWGLVFAGGNNASPTNDYPVAAVMARGDGVSSYVGGELSFQTKTASASALSQKMVIDKNGKVGIGTITPYSLFHIRLSGDPTSFATATDNYLGLGGVGTSNGYVTIGFGYAGSASAYRPAAITYKNTQNGSNQAGELGFWTRNDTSGSTVPTQRMVITDDGNVGIGTGVPATTLTVAQNASDSGIRLYGYAPHAASYMNFRVDSGGHTNLETSGGSYTKFMIGSGYFILQTAVNESIYNDFGGYYYWRDLDASSAVRMSLDSSNGNLTVNGTLQVNGTSINLGNDDINNTWQYYGRNTNTQRTTKYFSVSASGTQARSVDVCRLFFNLVHWGTYGDTTVELIDSYYGGSGYLKYKCKAGNGNLCGIELVEASGDTSGMYAEYGAAVDTGAVYSGYANYYVPVKVFVKDYRTVKVIVSTTRGIVAWTNTTGYSKLAFAPSLTYSNVTIGTVTNIAELNPTLSGGNATTPNAVSEMHPTRVNIHTAYVGTTSAGTQILNSSRAMTNIASLAINSTTAGIYNLMVSGDANISSSLNLGGALTGTTATFSGAVTSPFFTLADGDVVRWGAGTATYIQGNHAAQYINFIVNGSNKGGYSSTGLSVLGALTGTTATFSGSVGIGTTATPESLLHVRAYAGGNYTGEARIGGVNTTHGMLLSYTQLGATEGSIHVAPGYANSNALFKLRCSTNNTNQLVLKGDGRVGIGTAGPNAPLHIKSSGTNGNVFYVEASDSSHLAGIYEESDGRGALNVRNAGGTATINLDSGNHSWFTSGNVGIGTTSPAATLHVRDTNTGSGRWTAAFVADNAAVVTAQTHDHVLIQSNDVPSLKFYEYGQDQVGGIAVGDNNATISTTEAMRFYVNGSATGPLHDGLNGTCALKLQTNGTSDFYGNVTLANDKILSVGTTNGNSGAIRLYDGSSTTKFMDWEAVGTTTAWYRFNGGTTYTSPYRTYFNQQGSGGHNVYVDGDITSMGTGRYIYAVNLNVTGYKNFEIEHPTKEKMMLVHSSLEGPEAGVYHRGRVQSDTITMPDYWSGLVREDTITVQLTPNGSFQHLYVVSTSLSEIKIGAAEGETIDCYYIIYGERADVAPLVVEDAAAWERFQERKSAMSDGKA